VPLRWCASHPGQSAIQSIAHLRLVIRFGLETVI